MTDSQLIDALHQGRGMWCGSCHTVRILPPGPQVEMRMSLPCMGCGRVRWRSLSAEMFQNDPRFWGVDEPTCSG